MNPARGVTAFVPVLKFGLRRLLAPALQEGWYRWHRGTMGRARGGDALRKGITAVVAARNEDYLIGFCLESVVGVVDQIVCIDNGSEDWTLELMTSSGRPGVATSRWRSCRCRGRCSGNAAKQASSTYATSGTCAGTPT